MTAIDWKQGDVTTAGVNVHYYRTGNGDKPALVLAHGLTDNGLCWSRVAGQLASDFDIVMFDARNHGLSGDGAAALSDLVADMAHLIVQLGLDRPAAMGHSVGASVVAGLAAAHPEMVSRVVLEDPPWMFDPASQNTEKARRQRDGFKDYVKSLSRKSLDEIIVSARSLYPTWHEDDLPAWAMSKMQVRAHAMDRLDLGDWRDTVTQIGCPAHLVYADGGIVNQQVVMEVEAKNSQLSSSRIDGAGHNIRREQFDDFIGVVKRFLAMPV